jgi:UDPglucose 6-dehydrogenase
MYNRNIDKDTISVVGLGKLGLCLALSFACRGIKVIGVDINETLIDSLNKGEPLHHEPLLKDFLRVFRNNICFTSDHARAIKESDITIILVHTPSDTYGSFSNQYVESALDSLARSFKAHQKKYHLFIISSTLMPGSIKDRLIPLMENNCKLKYGRDFGLAFVPDFVALGKVISDFLNPDFVLIGEEDKQSGDFTENLYRRLVGPDTPFFRIPFIDAELAKVALNCYVTTKISFANSLASLCEKIPGANVDNVTETISHDRRVNPYYIKGGTSFGGTCFPRDTTAYLALAKKYGSLIDLIQATSSINEKTDKHIIELIEKYSSTSFKRVVFLGSAFKKDTPVIERSVASNAIPKLLKKGYSVSIYDPLAMAETKRVFGSKINYLEKEEIFKSKSIFVLPIESLEYINLPFKKAKKESVIIDCWRMLNKSILNEGIKYHAVGVAPEE